MQKRKLIPTPLIERSARQPIEIIAPRKPSRLRIWTIIGFVLRSAWLWWRSSFLLRFKGYANPRAGAERIRAFVERMGGMWVKAGQLIALRRDLFLPETCDELSKLQDRALGFPWELVKRAIEEDLGGPIENFFSEFNQTPIAAASIGQTHEARLLEGGVRVAVKVQRPFVADTFSHDFRYVKFATFLAQTFGMAPQFRWGELVRELEQTISDELDYRKEAASIRRMRKTLRKHKVYVPKVFARYCSRRVLVMEFIEGVYMSEYIKVAEENPAALETWMQANDIDPTKLGTRLLLSQMRQLNEDNLFHCDLHPGNILLQRNSRFAFIDFGAIGNLDRTFKQKYSMLESAVAQGDDARAADMVVLIAPPLPNGIDVAAFKADIAREIRSYRSLTDIKGVPFRDKSAWGMNAALTKVMRQYEFPASWDLLRLGRARATLDAALTLFIPEADPLKIARKYERQAAKRSLRSARKPKARTRLAKSLLSAAELPGMLSETLLFEGDRVRRRAMNFEAKLSAAGQVATSVLSLLRFTFLTSCAVLAVHYLRKSANGAVLSEQTWLRRASVALVAHWPEALVLMVAALVYLFGSLRGLRRFAEKNYYERGARPD